jgi:hypothetical protein
MRSHLRHALLSIQSEVKPRKPELKERSLGRPRKV